MDGAQQTASLKLTLEGLKELLESLRQIEDAIDRVKAKGGSIQIGSTGQSAGSNPQQFIGGIGSPNISSGPIAFNQNVATSDMDVLSLSSAGSSASTPWVADASFNAIARALMYFKEAPPSWNYAAGSGGGGWDGSMLPAMIQPQWQSGASGRGYAALNGLPTSPLPPQMALPGYGQSSWGVMNSIPTSDPYSVGYGRGTGAYLPAMTAQMPQAGNMYGQTPMSQVSGYGYNPYNANGTFNPYGSFPNDPIGQVGAYNPVSPSIANRFDPNSGLMAMGPNGQWGLADQIYPNGLPDLTAGNAAGRFGPMMRMGMYYAIRASIADIQQISKVGTDIQYNGAANYTSQRTEGPSSGLGLTAMGLVIGSAIGQPIIGAALGAVADNIVSGMIAPAVEQNIQRQSLQNVYDSIGNGTFDRSLPTNQLSFAQQAVQAGTPLPQAWMRNFQTHETVAGVTGAGEAPWSTPVWKSQLGIFRQDATDMQKSAFLKLASSPFVESQLGRYDGRSLNADYVDNVIRLGGIEDPAAGLNALAGLETTTGRNTRERQQIAGQLETQRYMLGQLNIGEEVGGKLLAGQLSTAHTLGARAVEEAYAGENSRRYQLSLLGKVIRYGSDTPEGAAAAAQFQQFDIQSKKDIFQTAFGESESGIEATNAPILASTSYQAIAGSVRWSGQYFSAQAEQLRERSRLYANAAKLTNFGLSPEERNRLSAQASEMAGQANIYDYQAMSANAQGTYAISLTETQEKNVGPQTALIFGAGGAEAFAARSSLAAGAQESVTAARRLLANYDPESREGLQARRDLANAQVRLAQAEVDKAIVPMGGYQAASLLGLQSEESVLKSGLIAGAPGDIRRNLTSQMSVLSDYIKQIDTDYDMLSKENGGRPNPEQARRLAEKRANAVSELASVSKEFNYGYMDRLMSIAANLPQEQAWIARAMFSNREASQAGVLHPSIGGTKQQIQQMQALGFDLRNLATSPGGGSAAGFTQQAQGSGTTSTPIEIIVRLEDSRGVVLSKNAVTIENGKTANDFRARVPLSQQPGA